jgi:hypothetical protein
MKRKKTPSLRQQKLTLDNLNVPIPENIEKYLNKEQVVLLRCVLANYTLQEISKHTKLARKDILYSLLSLGRQLFAYEICENKLLPYTNFNSKNYLHGWRDCKNTVRRLVNGK